MAIRDVSGNRTSYGQSGAGSESHYGSGRIGVTENSDCQRAL